jgi:hypothetical protein
MRIIIYLLEYIHGNNPKSIRDIMVKSKSRSIYTMAKRGRNILEKVEKYLKKGNNLGRNSSSLHYAGVTPYFSERIEFYNLIYLNKYLFVAFHADAYFPLSCEVLLYFIL